MFVERLALRFLMTGGRTKIRSHFEQLHSPSDLEVWLSSEFGATAAPVSSDDLSAALALREAVFAIIRAMTRSVPPSQADYSAINLAAEADPLRPMLDQTGQIGWSGPIGGAPALSTIARDAIDLLGSDIATRVRECENPKCELVFVDFSPPGRRRWCAMGRCGNRAKTKAYRDRNKPSQPSIANATKPES